MLTALQAAIKAKAPIVAIPMEGRAPICVDRKRLAGWAKGLTIQSVKVVQLPEIEEFIGPKDGEFRNRVGCPAEGPELRKTKPGPRYLHLTASPKTGYIRCTAKFIPIDRRVAVRELGKWSEKEREKVQKARLLGALGASERKALKRLRYEEEGEGLVSVMVRMDEKEPKVERKGVMVSIPELAEFQFAVVRLGEENEISFSVTEVQTGRRVGVGGTADEAILKVRKKIAGFSAEKLEEIKAHTRKAIQEEMEAVAAD